MNTVERWTSWRKSTFSDGTNAGNCVEIGFTIETVAVRDSKNPDGPHLEFPQPHWHLLTGLES